MLDGIVWFFTNVAMAFYNFFYALFHPGSWLNWSDKESLVRFIYYGASVELGFVVFVTLVILTLVGIWRPGFMWGGVRGLEAFHNGLGRVIAWAGLIMVIQQVLIVFVQRVFATSTITLGFGTAVTFDISWWAEGLKFYNALIVALCVAYTFVQGGHVRVDIVYSAVSFRTKKIIDMVGSIIFMLPVALLIWLYSWFFMWRHLILPAPSASDTLERLISRARVLRWNVETTGFAPQGFSGYFLFKILLVLFALLVFTQAIAFFWRSMLEWREGPESEDKYLDRDVLEDIHSGPPPTEDDLQSGAA